MHDHTTCFLLAGVVVDGGVLQTPVCFANKFVLPTVHMCNAGREASISAGSYRDDR